MSSTSKKKAGRTAVSKRPPSTASARGKRRTGMAPQSDRSDQASSQSPKVRAERSKSAGDSAKAAVSKGERGPAPRPVECAEHTAAEATVAKCASDAPGAVENAPATRERPGTKRELVVAMLQRPDGASLAQLTTATGWLPHTARAALTGLRQNGFVLEKSKNAQAVTVYRIAQRAISSMDSQNSKLEGVSSSGQGAGEGILEKSKGGTGKTLFTGAADPVASHPAADPAHPAA